MRLSVWKLVCVLAVMTAPAAADTMQKSLGISHGGTLKVESEGASVSLTAGPPGQVTVDVTSDGKIGQDVQVEVRAEAGGVAVSVEYPERGMISGLFRRDSETRVRIAAPAEIALELALSGGGFDSGLNVTGAVAARVSGGDLRLGGVGASLDARLSGGNAKIGQVAGDARIRASGGDAELGPVGGALRATVSGGNVTFASVSGAVELHASGGDVRGGPVDGAINARLSGGSLELGIRGIGTGAEISSSGGDVVLRIEPGAAFDLDVSSSGGDVSAGIPVSVEGKIVDGHLAGKVNGGGQRLQVRASGGSVRLEPASGR